MANRGQRANFARNVLITLVTHRFRFVVGLLFAAALLLAQSQSQSSLAQIGRADISRAVVELLALGPGNQGKNRECQATGFLVNEDGYILTNAHVVDEARDCLASTPNEHILAKPLTAEPTMADAVPCDLVVSDEIHDLALLKAQRPLHRHASQSGPSPATPVAEQDYLPLDATLPEDGTEVAVSGHPAFAWHAETRSGRIVGHESLALSGKDSEKSEIFYLDIRLLKGSSGSPVYRPSDGSVVGIVERKDLQHPGRTIAVAVRYAIELLERAGAKWHPPR